jgi:hypothetical protein
MSNVIFCRSGSEAIEACWKMARHYFVEIGEPPLSKFIAHRQSYHGITLGTLCVGGRLAARAPFINMLIEVEHVSPCYAYRERAAGETATAYRRCLAGELDARIAQLVPHNVAAFVAETIAGTTLGAVPAVPGYFKAIRDVCDRHGVLLSVDEVMSGMGLTGTLHACEQEGIATLRCPHGVWRNLSQRGGAAARPLRPKKEGNGRPCLPTAGLILLLRCRYQNLDQILSGQGGDANAGPLRRIGAVHPLIPGAVHLRLAGHVGDEHSGA